LQEAAVPGLILAAVSPDNTPAGYNWTFAFPGLLFIVIGIVLYWLFSRPHRRVPGRPIVATSSGSRVPDAKSAQAAPRGTSESHDEPAAAESPASERGGAHLTGSVDQADTGQTSPDDGKSEPGTGG
jgi:hypothetical protein